MENKITKGMRSRILKKTNYTCACCGKSILDTPDLVLDVRLKKGMPFSEDNLETVCFTCAHPAKTINTKTKQTKTKSTKKENIFNPAEEFKILENKITELETKNAYLEQQLVNATKMISSTPITKTKEKKNIFSLIFKLVKIHLIFSGILFNFLMSFCCV